MMEGCKDDNVSVSSLKTGCSSASLAGAAARARARAEAARARASFAEKETRLRIEKAEIEAKLLLEKAKLDAELAALNLQREAVAAVVQAEALEAVLDVDSGAPSASVSKLLLEKDITERTSNYIEAQSKLHNHTVDTPHQTVLHKHVPCRKQEQSLFLTAVENTWIHGRQKRREQKRQLRELPRAPHCAATSSQTTEATAVPTTNPSSQNQPSPTENTQDDNTQDKTAEESNGASSNETSVELMHDASGEQKEEIVTGKDTESSACTEAPAAASEPPLKRPLSPSAVEHFLFKCLVNVMLEQSDVVVEMHWVEGQNKDLMNQLCTYLKNTLLKSVAKS
eukprot:superscaffoldBa00000404_g4446